MQTPAAVLGVRAREDVVPHLDLVGLGDGSVGDGPGDDDARHDEERSAVLAGPVSGGLLQLLEEFEAIVDCFEGGLRFG